MIKTIEVKLNVDMLHYKKGSILTLTSKKYSGEGVFLSPYFKKRIKDSKIDNCLEVLTRHEVDKINSGSDELTKKAKEYRIDQDDLYKTVKIDKQKKRGRPKTKKD